MTQPPGYTRQYDFTSFATSNPTTPLPGNKVDLELNTAKQTLDAIRTNLALIQRDDGDLANDSVGVEQMKAEVTLGLNAVANWASGTAYSPNNGAWYAGKLYRCLLGHTSDADFAVDLAADRWVELLDVRTTAEAEVLTAVSGVGVADLKTSLEALGLDAATLGGVAEATGATPSTIVKRDASGDISANVFVTGVGNSTDPVAGLMYRDSSGNIKSAGGTHIVSSLGLTPAEIVTGINTAGGVDADLLGGYAASVVSAINTVAVRDAAGYLAADGLSVAGTTPDNQTMSYVLYTMSATPNQVRKASIVHLSASLDALIAPAWANITGKPSTFTPSSHNHAASEITSGTLAEARLPVRSSEGLGTTVLAYYSVAATVQFGGTVSGANLAPTSAGGGVGTKASLAGTWRADGYCVGGSAPGGVTNFTRTI